MLGPSKNIWGFDPRNVPGCQLWFDAADSSTITLNGSTVSSWRDKSMNGYSVSQSTSGNQPTYATNLLNGLPGIQLSSQKYLEQFGSNMPNFTSSTSTTVLIVAKNGSTVPSNGWNIVNTCWFNSSGTGINRYHFSFAQSGTNGVTLYANGGFVGVTNPYSLGSNAIIGFTASSSGNSINVNGTLTTYSGTSLPSTNNSTFFRFGDDRASFVSDVNIYEFIGFNTTITASQRQQIEGYLAWKWGIQSLLPSTQLYKTIRPQLRIFQPTDISGCQLWLDAADSSTLTLQAGNKVSAWLDKSLNRYVMSNATTLTQPTYVTSGWNGSYPGVQVTGNSSGQHNFLSNAAFSGFNTTTWDIYAVVKHSANTQQSGIMWIDPSGSYIVISSDIGTSQFVYTTLSNFGWRLNPTMGTATTQNPYIFQNYSTGTTLGRRLNGVQPGLSEQIASVSWTARSGTYPFFLANPSGGWSGPTTHFGELLMFNKTLSDSERLQLEGYLSTKWGLTQTSFSSTSFNPTSISGCQLWFDASDTASLTPSSIKTGTKVSQWNDKSGNNRHMSNATSATQPTYSTSNFNGTLPCVYFSGSRDSSTNANILSNAASTVLNSTTWDIYVAFKPTGGQEAIFWNDPNSAVVVIAGNTKVYDANYSILYGSWRLAPNDGACRGNECQLFQAYSTGTTIGKRVNGGFEGAQAQTASYSWPSRSSNSELAFCRPSSSGWSEGNLAIAEVIVYNSVLSDTNRSNVQTYLTNKWKIGKGLQIDHPYYSIPSSTVTRPNFKELAYTGSDYNAYFAKYSSDGSVLWALRWTATGGISIQDIATDSSGNLYVTGLYVNSSLLMYDTNGLLVRTLVNTGDYDGLVAKYTTSGVLLWTSRHTGPVSTYPTGVAVDSSGNVYAGGAWNGASLTIYSAGEASSNTYGTTGGQTDGYIVKYDSSGIVQWSAKIVCSSYDTGGVSLKTDSSGNVYSVGINVFAAPTFYNANGTTGGSLSWGGTTEGAWLAKWNSSGTYQWALRFLTGDLNTVQGALSIDSSGNLYVSAAYDSTLTLKNSGDGTAATMTNSGSYDAFLVKYSSAGVYSWNVRVGGTGSSDEIANAIDGSGNLYIMGRYTGTIIVYTSGEGSSTTLTNSGGYDTFIAKYSSAGVLSWATRIASTANDTGSALSVDSAGNVYAHGTYEGTITFFNVGGGTGGTLSNSSADTYLAKYTTSGTFLWAARITGSASEASRTSRTDPDGNIYVGGIYNSSPLTLNGV